MQLFFQAAPQPDPDYHGESQPIGVPQHIALIMDGNGRWALQRGLHRTQGHQAGAENMLGVVRTCIDLGVRYLTVYIFSTENWRRPRSEVEGMLQLVGDFIDHELLTIHRWGVRLRHLGRLDGIDEPLRRKVSYALELTRHNTGMTLAVALNYGGRDDLVAAVQALVQKGVPADEIDEQTIAAHLSTVDMPDPDLVIRTSGEQRLSNFLLWESAHSTCWTTPVLWPDFKPHHLRQAIAEACKGR